jgi:hypothetical protein
MTLAGAPADEKRNRRVLTWKFRLCVLLLAVSSCGSTLAQSELYAKGITPFVEGSAPLGAANNAPDLHARHKRLLWLVSIPVFIAANVLDASSSWGHPEANRLLQGNAGRFDGRSVALKFGIAGGMIAGEYSLIRMLKKNSASRDAALTGSAWSNFAGAGVLSGAAIHNYKLSSNSVHTVP